MKVAIIGVGLIGGSLAIDLRKREFSSHIIGVDNNKLHANTALQIGFVDEIKPLDEAVESADLVILATPVDATHTLLPKILNLVDKQVVIDMCSTKRKIVELANQSARRENFVAAHPMAGTEFSGPWAAIPDLYDGKVAILCDIEQSNQDAVALAEKMFGLLNMTVIYMNSEEHDVHAAYVSHISHISSFALALTVLEQEKNEKHIFNLASGGFDSTVRLAKSSSEMWTPIFMQNENNVLTVLDTYINKLNKFRQSIAEKNKDAVHDLIIEANRIKRILKK